MHLAERRGGERLGLEAREELLRRRSELARHLRANDVVRHRRHRRLHGREDLERLGRQQVAPHAQHLRELHERALQLRRALDDADRVPHVGVEQIALGARLRLKRPLQRLPDVAAADRGRERADLHHATRPSGGERALRRRARPGSSARGRAQPRGRRRSLRRACRRRDDRLLASGRAFSGGSHRRRPRPPRARRNAAR